VVTQARRTADVRENAREAIAVWTEKQVQDIDVTVTVVVPTVGKQPRSSGCPSNE
jgi:hypothetical protein